MNKIQALCWRGSYFMSLLKSGSIYFSRLDAAAEHTCLQEDWSTARRPWNRLRASQAQTEVWKPREESVIHPDEKAQRNPTLSSLPPLDPVDPQSRPMDLATQPYGLSLLLPPSHPWSQSPPTLPLTFSLIPLLRSRESGEDVGGDKGLPLCHRRPLPLPWACGSGGRMGQGLHFPSGLGHIPSGLGL